MIDKNKTYRTRDGREVRIYAVDGGGGNPVHGAALESSGWHKMSWRQDGSWCVEYPNHPLDLIEVKPRIKREVWVNVYPSSEGIPHRSKKSADVEACEDRIACVRLTIDCAEGEGL